MTTIDEEIQRYEREIENDKAVSGQYRQRQHSSSDFSDKNYFSSQADSSFIQACLKMEFISVLKKLRDGQ